MRAVIRAKIIDVNGDIPDRDNKDRRAEYNEKIIELFKSIGYSAYDKVSENEKDLGSLSKFGKDLDWFFEWAPDIIRNNERCNSIMIGYTSSGQAKFVVTTINQNDLHIRVRDDLFDKLRKGCQEICSRAIKLEKRAKILHFIPIYNKINYLHIEDYIEVMEPHHGHATIEGKVIRDASAFIGTEYKSEKNLAIISFTMSLVFLFFHVDIANYMQPYINYIHKIEVNSISGFFDKISSALMITAFVASTTLILKWLNIKNETPIMWNAAIKKISR